MIYYQVAEVADKVLVETFVPKKGVHIETDPKAEKKETSLPTSTDDESVIDGLLAKLTAIKGSLPAGYKLSPIQVRA